jgi:hypothetical protein
MTAAESFSEEAQQKRKAGDAAAAETSYLKSIQIQERVDPHSPQLARTLEDYAALLRASNRKEDADVFTVRAANVRNNIFGNQEWPEAGLFRFDFYAKGYGVYTGLTYGETARLIESDAEAKAAAKFAVENASKLPNIEGTIIALSGAGEHFGRLLISSNKSGTFKVYVRQGNVTLLKVLNSSKEEFDITVSDEQGAPIQKAGLEFAAWESMKTGTYTITLSNKTARRLDYVLSLSTSAVFRR